MKVSRTSWHYRWWNEFHNNSYDNKPRKEPKNLCQYFWGIVGPMLGLGFMGLTVLSAIGIGLWVAFTQHTLTALIVTFSITGFVPTYYLIYRLDKWVEARPERLPQPEREPGPFRAYFRARKQRVCPLIEVTD